MTLAATTRAPFITFTILTCVLALGISWDISYPSAWPLPIATLVVLFVGGLLSAPARRRWEPRLRAWLEEITAAIDRIDARWVAGAIVLSSAVAIAAELMLIRWHSTAFHLFGYFKNISLLGAFLGLGIGYALGGRVMALPLALPALCAQIGLMQALRYTNLQVMLRSPVSEQLAIGADGVNTFWHAMQTYSFLAIVFITTALACIPLGQLPARLMRRLPPLRAYGWNLVGSLAGIASQALLACLWSPPSVWLLLVAVGLSPFLCLARPVTGVCIAWGAVALAVATLSAPFRPDRVEIHSPYQVVTLLPMHDGVIQLEINNSLFQYVADLRPAAREANDRLRQMALHYDLPYLLKPRPDRVLIVGSGTGNDVAAAVRAGAKRIDAVEIDPAILGLGRSLHPERPYACSNVTAIVDDARHFIRTTDARYDVIAYGTLDSHVLTSGKTNVRLDSFVFTVEAFREARARLAPGGVLVLAFATVNDAMNVKLFRMLQEAFDGTPPRALGATIGWGATFVAGDTVTEQSLPGDLARLDVTAECLRSPVATRSSTDDWPFLYMPLRTYPITYLVMVGLILILSALMVKDFLALKPDRHAPAFFLLGAGFMLVETKAITELSLVFGSTWIVVSVVIAGVLAMAFAANCWVAKANTRRTWPALVALFALLVTGAVLTPGSFAFSGGGIVATGLVVSPMLCSGVIFSITLNKAGDVGPALAWNLLGAMLGGFLEYNSMYFGIRALNWFALAIYALAFLFTLRKPALSA